jgi:acyl carrier protein
MSQDQMLASVAGILHDVAQVPTASVTPDKHIADELGVDSLAMVEVVVAAECRFSVRIPDQVVDDLVTVADLIDYIRGARLVHDD